MKNFNNMNVDYTLPNDIDFKYKNSFSDFFTPPVEVYNRQPITEQKIREILDASIKSYLKEIEIRLGIIEKQQIQSSFRTSICPVCRGKGSVAAGFYSLFGTSTSAIPHETCRSCSGKGYIIL